ncbi:hypothetical protein AaE_015630 [Aphanomyces astaci]|uniref:Protein kinase domain-containing protein n=1 Tax=Aphanomyces astaci TaxID=112090 RepID=A0A6A4Z171_APHAT|nr:hypothetical protein AaE_015630 [Aphanomyces astaci]
MSSSTASIEEAAGVAAAVAVGKDDARLGTHSFVVSGTTFQVDTKYKFIKPIGHGAYGVVMYVVPSSARVSPSHLIYLHTCWCSFQIGAKHRDWRQGGHQEGVQSIRRPYRCEAHLAGNQTAPAFRPRKRTYTRIITIVDLLPPPSLALFEDVYIISDLMETDLHRIIYSRQPLSDDHIQYFLYQILRALKYIHSSNVLHRDLKPSNLLLNSNCDLKVCDFGLARGVEPDEDNMELTEYVVTRWYRAPEIMLSTKEYTKAIDIWSTGCIFAELLGRKPMFPGDDYIHQLQIICDKLGTPTEDELHFVTSEKASTQPTPCPHSKRQEETRFMKSQPNKPKIPLDRLFPNVKPNALDLLDKMLVFDPSKRISVEEALQHPYLESLHNSDDEPKSTKPFSFEFEKENLTKRRLQELIAE